VITRILTSPQFWTALVAGLFLAVAKACVAHAGTFERSIEWTLGRHVGNAIWGSGTWAVFLALAVLLLFRRGRR
jgi:formate/nitrite transporter FocA (FNT family)